MALAHAGVLCGLAWARFANVHQRTFDLALYARIAWGLAHGDGWSPVLDTHFLGAHVAPVLAPLGLVGRLVGTVPVLLAAQALAVGFAIFPIARIGARRMGTPGVWLAGAAWLLYPNLGHVATYEFHPGTLAVLPLCWAYDSLDRAKLPLLAWSCAAVLLCREDFGLACALLGIVYFVQHRDRRALVLAGATLVYTVVALRVMNLHAPPNGSLDQHFGVWGGSPLGVLSTLFHDPARVWAHFTERERLLYAFRLLAPVSFFALRNPLWLVPALPYFGLNLVSVFPTSLMQYSHYLTPLVPPIVAAGVAGASVVRAKFVRVLWYGTLGLSHFALGGLLSRDFPREAFVADAQTAAARAVLAHVPPQASIQAPDPLLPHLAERRRVHRAPPPERGTDFVVLDVSHRQRFAGQESLLRTTEEPGVRTWLARGDHGLLVYAPPYALLQKGLDPRRAPAVQRYFLASPSVESETPLTACLSLRSVERVDGDHVALTLAAHGACPPDLALRIGRDPLPSRVELLFDGALSPAQLRDGDVVRSVHRLGPPARGQATGTLYVGVLRQRGAPPQPADPRAVPVPIPE